MDLEQKYREAKLTSQVDFKRLVCVFAKDKNGFWQ